MKRVTRSHNSKHPTTIACIFVTLSQVLLCNHGVAFALSSNNHHSYLDSLKPCTTSLIPSSDREREDTGRDDSGLGHDMAMEEVVRRTPDDHYAKHHPGAGWAGYKHPMYGGYLDHLSSSSSEGDKQARADSAEGTASVVSSPSASVWVGQRTDPHHEQPSPPTLNSKYLESLPENAWEHGKPADYGDDVRWGAQVYLDGL